MMMPRFTAEESIYRTNRHYRMSTTFNQVGGAIYPALGGETDEPVGWQFCVDKCKAKCITDRGCNQLTSAAKTQCKIGCENKCGSDCAGLGEGGPIIPRKCTDTDFAWRKVCLASCHAGRRMIPWPASELWPDCEDEVCKLDCRIA